MKMLTEKGNRQEVEQADPNTDEDEDTLWSTNTINLDTAQRLLYGIYFNNVRSFSLRFQKIHRDLGKEQFSVKMNRKVGVEPQGALHIFGRRLVRPLRVAFSVAQKSL